MSKVYKEHAIWKKKNMFGQMRQRLSCLGAEEHMTKCKVCTFKCKKAALFCFNIFPFKYKSKEPSNKPYA